MQCGVLGVFALGGENGQRQHALHDQTHLIDKTAPIGRGQPLQRANRVTHADVIGRLIRVLLRQCSAGIRQRLRQRRANFCPR